MRRSVATLLAFFCACLCLTTVQGCKKRALLIQDLEGRPQNTYESPYADRETEVSLAVWIQRMSVLCEKKQYLEMDLYLSEIWYNPTLEYANLGPCTHNISMPINFVEKMWTPNTAAINSIEMQVQKSPIPNVFTLIYSNGTVWLNRRFAMKVPCVFETNGTTATCKLVFLSFTYNANIVQMKWSDDAFLSLTHAPVSDFKLEGHDLERNTMQYPAGLWDELTLKLHFKKI